MTALLLSMEKQVSVTQFVLPPAVCYVGLSIILTLSVSCSILVVRKNSQRPAPRPCAFLGSVCRCLECELQTRLRPSPMRADCGVETQLWALASLACS